MFESHQGFLRPEGFLCGTCYQERCKDPAYVAEMENQLLGLLSLIADSALTESTKASASVSPLIPSSAAERLACESLVGLSVGDALGARFEGAEFDRARLNSIIEPDEPVIAIGSGGNYALSAARALIAHSDLDAPSIARESLRIAASICLYTNDQIVIEELT